MFLCICIYFEPIKCKALTLMYRYVLYKNKTIITIIIIVFPLGRFNKGPVMEMVEQLQWESLEHRRKVACIVMFYLNEWCFRPPFCTVKAILGRRQPARTR